MPTVSEQVAMPGTRTNPALVAARFLRTPGKTCERTIQDCEPFDTINKIDEDARSAADALIDEGAHEPQRHTCAFSATTDSKGVRLEPLMRWQAGRCPQGPQARLDKFWQPWPNRMALGPTVTAGRRGLR